MKVLEFSGPFNKGNKANTALGPLDLTLKDLALRLDFQPSQCAAAGLSGEQSAVFGSLAKTYCNCMRWGLNLLGAVLE